MKSYVVDTGALDLFFEGDKRLAAPFAEIERGAAVGLVTSPGLAEFYYKTCRKLGRDAAEVYFRRAERRLTVVAPDQSLASAAGLEKCRDNALSLVDCFALALARDAGGTLLTTDSALAAHKEIRILYFRA